MLYKNIILILNYKIYIKLFENIEFMNDQINNTGLEYLRNAIDKFKKGGKIEKMKKGSGIHIKPENKGKFTKSAKAAGEGVQEHAHKVMNDPDATPTQKKRANFAINAKKWHH